MIEGPDIIYECPKCKKLLRRGSLASGNTFGARIYSDGKRISPMLPEFPIITKCPQCEKIFWIKDARKIGERYYGNLYQGIQSEEKLKTAEDMRFLTIDEYNTALKENIYSTTDEELYIRLKIWRMFNDRVRNGEYQFTSENDMYLWMENVIRLPDILDVNNETHKIIMAELYRNYGDFENCLKMIRSIESEENKWLIKEFERECKNKNTKVFELTEPERPVIIKEKPKSKMYKPAIH